LLDGREWLAWATYRQSAQMPDSMIAEGLRRPQDSHNCEGVAVGFFGDPPRPVAGGWDRAGGTTRAVESRAR
jgi:hypothetical protein